MSGDMIVYKEGGLLVGFDSSTVADKINRDEVGEFGRMGKLVDNFDTINVSGVYRANNPPVGAPISVSYLVCFHTEGVGGRAYQKVTRGTHGGGLKLREFQRTRNNEGVWDVWSEALIDQVSVSQLEDKSVTNSKIAATEMVSDWNSIQETGFYRSSSSVEENPTLPVPERGAWSLPMFHLQGLGQRAGQLSFRVNGQLFCRGRGNTGDVTPWGEIPNTATLVRQVGQASGRCYISDGSFSMIRKESEFYNLSLNDIYVTASDLNDRYYKLAEEFPEYVTYDVLGQDDFGNDIVEFLFSAATPVSSNIPLSIRRHPHICIVSGTHGSEREAAVSTLVFCDDLCRNWQQNELMADLRWGANISVIACLTPSAVNAGNIRRNGNGVDINRNFVPGWEDVVDSTKGPFPLSERESQIAAALPTRYPYACAIIDIHGHASVNHLTWIAARTDESKQTAADYIRHNASWLMREMLDPQNENPRRVALTQSADATTVAQWQDIGELNAFLIEIALSWDGFSNRDIRRVGARSVLELVHKNWSYASKGGTYGSA